MRKNLFYLLFTAVVVFFSSCEEDKSETLLVDFESMNLGQSGYYDGSDKTGDMLFDGYYVKKINLNEVGFMNTYIISEFGGFTFTSWSGFAISSLGDTVTTGYANQYSAISGKGAYSSKQFGLAFDSAAVIFPVTNKYTPKSIMLNNSTYSYYGLLNGSDFSKKFAADDWFKVIITGYKGTTKSSTVEFYLADFRNGKSVIVKNWQKVDLSSLGQVDFISFTFDSTDKTGIWLNNPAYVCVDNLELEYQEILK